MASGLTTVAQPKQVCFTYDDLPVVSYGRGDSAYHHELYTKLLGAIERHNIPAIGFVNEFKLYKASAEIAFQVKQLERWADAGLELGNHTYSHPDYNNLSFTRFAEEITKGETVTRRIMEERGKNLRYFRHPFLHMGQTRERADSLSNFLAQHHYTIAPVTIDNADYLFAKAYEIAKRKGDAALTKKIGADYLEYMEKKVKYFEAQSVKLFGRIIPQVLLVHANLLNADHTDGLARMFVRNGYAFATLEQVLRDEAYDTPITVFGTWGISWLDRWALSAGKKGAFFEGDVPTPEYIVELSK